jgi:tetratricopeptide (TPR) repeat protein
VCQYIEYICVLVSPFNVSAFVLIEIVSLFYLVCINTGICRLSTEHNPMDGTAWNMLGILKERMGLKLGALEAFRNALSLSKENNRDFCRVNYGRLLARLGKYSQAIDMFTKIEAATFNSGSGLALTLFKGGFIDVSI